MNKKLDNIELNIILNIVADYRDDNYDYESINWKTLTEIINKLESINE